MRRPPFWIVLAILMFPVAAEAHDHNADFFFGFCNVHASNLPGYQFAFAKTLPNTQLSWVVDVGIHDGSHDDQDAERKSYMAGLRWMIAKPEQHHGPFLQVLVGGLRSSLGDGDLRVDENEFSLAFGLGYEIVPDALKGFGIRVSGDFQANGDQGFRFSSGVVYRWRR
jgi:hypothetical protein